MEGNYYNFRKAKVGGFNKKDVINYIEKMRNEFYDYKKAVESTVDSLNAKISELEALVDTDKCMKTAEPENAALAADDIQDPISDINDAAIKLRMVADELCRNLTNFMASATVEAVVALDEISDEVDCDVEAAQEQNEVKKDKVSEILGLSVNFIYEKDDCEIKEQKAAEDNKLILDKLSSSAFFN